MLYPSNSRTALSPELFSTPGAEYRGAPFWAWNTKLSKELLFFEIEQLKEMGMGGFHIHSRSGLATAYLSDEFMGLVRACSEKAKEEGMLCWLYDEDRWPSGAAGGIVTKSRAHRMRYLLFTPWKYGSPRVRRETGEMHGAMVRRNESGTLIGRYEVRLEGGKLAEYRLLSEAEPAGERFKEWFAYLEIAADQPWYNNQAYVNTLNRSSIERFIQITHERYYSTVGREFGKSIPAIFTDEPQFAHKQTLGFAEEERDLVIPYTDDFESTYRDTYGQEFLRFLPELFWKLPGNRVSVTRYRYHDHVAERFASAFADTAGSWCREHGIMLTGHMMEEPTLGSQTQALGEAMRSYRSFQLPGIDMLCDRRELTTAKQAQSAARQYAAPGVLSELYGVTGWHFDFRGHKLQGDWQAALGVTVRVHHLAWVSMAGEAKRDYPASIGYQSPWHRQYRMVEDHFARLNTALTRGKAVVRIAVIHPIESFWLLWGPREQTALARNEAEEAFANITNWLLYGQLDFDFLAESLLPSLAHVDGSKLAVGAMEYEVVTVPALRTMRKSTYEFLVRFRDRGGTVIFLGAVPDLVDAVPSTGPAELATTCLFAQMSRSALLKLLEPYREIEIRHADGAAAGSLHDNLIYQLRQDGRRRWLFICHVRPPRNSDLPWLETVTVRIHGRYDVTLYDTGDGTTRVLQSLHTGGEADEAAATLFSYQFAAHDSLLLALDPRAAEADSAAVITERTRDAELLYRAEHASRVEGPVDIELSEPNVLLLDRAEYALDGGEWQQAEELLRADNEVRRTLGWPMRGGRMAQPWVEPEEKSPHTVSLRFTIRSEVVISQLQLALEQASRAKIEVNGKPISVVVKSWYVDRDIGTVDLPDLAAGQTELVVTVPVGRRSGLEWCYLLGDFGVRVEGAKAVITPPVRMLSFGDWTTQGLPFYAGNVRYKLNVTVGGRLALQVPQFRNPVLAVHVDGAEVSKIAYSPYIADLGTLSAGSHLVEIVAYGNRANAFGPVHNCNDTLEWWGPPAWRTGGSEWSYEYRLRKMGILTSPQLLEIGEKGVVS